MDILAADWPAPSFVHAFTTLKTEYQDFGQHQNSNLTSNTDALIKKYHLPSTPVWLKQVHQTNCHCLDANGSSKPTADASYTHKRGKVCAILTADCLPIFMTNTKGTFVAAIHGGWRSLAGGIVRQVIGRLNENPSDLLVWLGPAIGPNAFEVGEDVYQQFKVQTKGEQIVTEAFQPTLPGKWLVNIFSIAKIQLQSEGILSHHIFGGGLCTYTQVDSFYSYRRSQDTGRMASLIWMDPP